MHKMHVCSIVLVDVENQIDCRPHVKRDGLTGSNAYLALTVAEFRILAEKFKFLVSYNHLPTTTVQVYTYKQLPTVQ